MDKRLEESIKVVINALPTAGSILYSDNNVLIVSGSQKDIILSLGLIIGKILKESIISAEELNALITTIKEIVAKEMVDELLNRHDN